MGVAASTKGPSKERPHEGERRRLGRMQTSADRGGTREGGKEGGRDGGRDEGREGETEGETEGGREGGRGEGGFHCTHTSAT